MAQFKSDFLPHSIPFNKTYIHFFSNVFCGSALLITNTTMKLRCRSSRILCSEVATTYIFSKINLML